MVSLPPSLPCPQGAWGSGAEFVGYLPCYRSADAGIQSQCGPACDLEARMAATKAQLREAQAAKDLRRMSRIMDGMCRSASAPPPLKLLSRRAT